MNQFANQDQSDELTPPLLRQRRKTGPSPKYGPDQAKKMVSMRLSPDALQSIKRAAELVFRDSQADVVEQITRIFPPEALQRIFDISQDYNVSPNELIGKALDAFCLNSPKVSKPEATLTSTF